MLIIASKDPVRLPLQRGKCWYQLTALLGFGTRVHATGGRAGFSKFLEAIPYMEYDVVIGSLESVTNRKKRGCEMVYFVGLCIYTIQHWFDSTLV